MSRTARPAAPWIVVTGLDGSGKTTLARRLAAEHHARSFRLPHHRFVKAAIRRSGRGTPFGDVHTDRLIFAADARLTDPLIHRWRARHRLLVSQRGWMDNFIFGAVQGVSYEQTDALLRTAELERASAIVYLVADSRVAYERIRLDPGADKYETPEFLEAQYRETLRFFQAARDGHPALAAFAGIPACLIDTGDRPEDPVYREAARFLAGLAPGPAIADAGPTADGPMTGGRMASHR